MSEYTQHLVQEIYDGESKAFRVSIDLTAETVHAQHDHDAVDAVERLRDAIEKESQAIQDELDEERGG